MEAQTPTMWDDDEDDQRPYKKSPAEVGPQVMLWLLFETTVRVLAPSLLFMFLGIWLGAKLGHKQAWAISGTLVGLAIAALLVWQQARSQRRQK